MRFNGHGYTTIGEEVGRIMEDFFRPSVMRTAAASGTCPAINVWEDADHAYVEAELPGLRGSDLDISVVGSELTLSGSRSHVEREGAAYHRRERSTGDFSRVIRLPAEVDAEHVQASLTDGVLLVKLPKASTAKPHKIEITGG